MKHRHPLILFFAAAAVALLASCGRRTASAPGGADSLTFKYARLLHVYRHGGWDEVRIDNPWRRGETLHTYCLVPRGSKPPQAPAGATVVSVPVERSVVFTSVHCGLLAQLGALGAVSGVCDSRYILMPAVREYIRKAGIPDMGQSFQPNVERIIALRPDALLVSPFANSGGYGKLGSAGLPLIECADYMEGSALGRAEWMRFFGMLYGCAERADSLFAVVERGYNGLKQKAAATKSRPKLMCDLPMGGVWYVPGGGSALGEIFRDAGADYSAGKAGERGSVRLSAEKAVEEMQKADYWFIRKGGADKLTYESLARENTAYTLFRPWRERHIYACNTLKVPYFDEEPFRPDYMLRDLVMTIHPELGAKGAARYFTPIK